MSRVYLSRGGYWLDDGDTSPVNSVNVFEYNAKGDGITDDTEAIRQALNDAVASKRNLYFRKPPVGYVVQTPDYSYRSTFGYRTGAITLDGVQGLTIYGDPGGSRLIMRTPSGGRAVNNAFVLVPPWAGDSGAGAPAGWLPGHAYTDGQQVIAPNGHTYAVRGGGSGTSGAVGPSDLTSSSGDVLDGTVRWALTDIPYYGQMFRLRNDPVTGQRCSDIVFKNLIFDGDSKRNASLWNFSLGGIASGAMPWNYVDPTFGAVPAGEGYAAGHSAVAMDQNSQYGKVTFEDCTLKNWRSEIYRGDYGAPFVDTITIRRCYFDSHTGNAVSCTTPLVMDDCEFNDAGQAIENDGATFDQFYKNIRIHDGGVGFVVPSSTGTFLGRGQMRISGLTVERCSSWGVFVSGYAANVWFDGVKCVDNALLAGAEQIHVGQQFGTSPINVHFNNIEVGVHSRSSATSFSLSGSDSTCTLDNAKVTRTPDAISHGYTTGPALVGNFPPGGGLYCKGLDFRQALTLGNGLDVFAAGESRIDGSRIDGLYQINSPDLDLGWHSYYEYKPVGATSLSTPKRVPYGAEVMVVLNNQMTLVHGAGAIELAGAANITPASTVGAVWFHRPSLASMRIVETRRVPA